MEVKNLKLSSVHPSPMNPRKTFDEGALKELADNIRQQGLLQPITVRPLGGADGEYEIVCGERRYRAFRILCDEWKDLDCVAPKGTSFNQWSEITAIVKEMTDEEAFDAMITENLQRQNVDPIEEAFAFGQLIKSGKTAEEVALRFGRSIRFIQDRIKLNSLIPELMKEVKDDKMPISAAMIICKVTEDQQRMYFKQYKNNYQGFSTATAMGFVRAMFLDIADAVWKSAPDFAGGCGTPCAQCSNNTANHGCLFYEMKAQEGQCTNLERYQSKTLAYIEDYLSKISDTLVKVGEPLEKGKTVVAINIDGYAPEFVKRLKTAIRDRAFALGYDVADPNKTFKGRCYYNFNDERTQALLESGECYSVLQLASYNCIIPELQAWYLKRGDVQTNVDGSGKPVKVQNLLSEYKRAKENLSSQFTIECAKTMVSHNNLSNEPLTDVERKMFMLFALHASYELRKKLQLAAVSSADKDAKYIDEHPEIFNICARACIQGKIVIGNNPALLLAEPFLDDLGALWCPEEYQKTKQKVQAKYDKTVAKIKKELAGLGYTLDGEKITDPAPAEEPKSSKYPVNIDTQYKEMKKEHPDALLLFRVGDFYETFNEDAKKAAEVLGITLTKRDGKMLAGFPHHALDTYLPKLIKAGLKVAICEQLRDPKKK